MKKQDIALAVGVGATLAVVQVLREAKRTDDVWNFISKQLNATTADMVETVHLLTGEK